jgi:hypothetical protein
MTASWLKGFRRTFLGNATATRDSRILLRGVRVIVLLTTLMLVVSSILVLLYADRVNNGSESGRELSIAEAQMTLGSVRDYVFGLIWFGIAIAAPALGAFAIVTERKRRSLDLIFSAPVSAIYYIVGKLASSYKFLWLVLILSLPTASVSLLAGGLTITELFISFLLYSVYGLMLTALGLAVSCAARTQLDALVRTYILVIGWAVVQYGLGASLALGFGFQRSVPAAAAFSPMVFPITTAPTELLGITMPLYVVSVFGFLILTAFFVIVAATTLMPERVSYVRAARIFYLVLLGITFYGFQTLGKEATVMTQISFTPFWVSLCLFLLGASGNNGSKRFLANGLFNIKEIFRGKPAGNIPFMLLAGSMFWITLLIHSAFGTASIGSVGDGLIFWAYTMVIGVTSQVIGQWTSANSGKIATGQTFTLLYLIFHYALIPIGLGALAMMSQSQSSAMFAYSLPYGAATKLSSPSAGWNGDLDVTSARMIAIGHLVLQSVVLLIVVSFAKRAIAKRMLLDSDIERIP